MILGALGVGGSLGLMLATSNSVGEAILQQRLKHGLLRVWRGVWRLLGDHCPASTISHVEPVYFQPVRSAIHLVRVA